MELVTDILALLLAIAAVSFLMGSFLVISQIDHKNKEIMKPACFCTAAVTSGAAGLLMNNSQLSSDAWIPGVGFAVCVLLCTLTALYGRRHV